MVRCRGASRPAGMSGSEGSTQRVEKGLRVGNVLALGTEGLKWESHRP